MHSLLQDSLLASPIILDLVILTELCQRVAVQPQGEEEFQSFHSILALLAFLCKAPLVPPGTPVINAFFRQRACIENIMRYEGGMDTLSSLAALKNKTVLICFGKDLFNDIFSSSCFPERAWVFLLRITCCWNTNCRKISYHN